MEPRISRRAAGMPASPIRKLAGLADEAKRGGARVYHLNIGQPDIPTPQPFMKALRGFRSRVLEYGPSQGFAEYREALACYYLGNGIRLTPDQILVTTGGSEAILFAMCAVCSEGDEIIVPEPFYTNYMGYSVMAGVTLVPVATDPAGGYRLPSRRELEACVSRRTRAILLCTPNNPTGTVYTRAELELAAGVALDHGLFLLSDEAYREFVYEGRHASVMHLKGLDANAILLDSVSKRYSACGARIGCMASRNQDVMRAALRFGQARLCPPSAEQAAATAACGVGGEYFEALRAEYRRRRDAVCAALARMPGVSFRKPSGAFYVMARLPVRDADDFARWLLTDFRLDGKTVMVAPGSGFYATPGSGAAEVRIAYVLKEAQLRDAMRVLAAGLARYTAGRAGEPAGGGQGGASRRRTRMTRPREGGPA